MKSGTSGAQGKVAKIHSPKVIYRDNESSHNELRANVLFPIGTYVYEKSVKTVVPEIASTALNWVYSTHRPLEWRPEVAGEGRLQQ